MMEKVNESKQETWVKAEDVVRVLEIDPEVFQRWCRLHIGKPSEPQAFAPSVSLVS
ncbi:hypothetical protein [Paenibacillus mucilaginosus]|uniref:Uncharacterized protein n=2 Tax=Paenibacillus mucilaginosus TaxID=61624 RepID=F8FK13_PAEMK|nr:hypothetical protein [Paenibacillus mucilaginosus]AEI44054.1 hypothetical protein KNP414_05530 [Paenibacillus mucilaginosus KNP414]MCG7212459.1 hypothetical protein [Paenibacillus mucilaginosus]WDM25503.1 hypothetical protein KCX80_24010 [Paenibacillus mucilaginosus]